MRGEARLWLPLTNTPLVDFAGLGSKVTASSVNARARSLLLRDVTSSKRKRIDIGRSFPQPRRLSFRTALHDIGSPRFGLAVTAAGGMADVAAAGIQSLPNVTESSLNIHRES